MRSHLFLLILGMCAGHSLVHADPGKPVAVRWWGQAMVSIETYWNLKIVIDPYSLSIGYKDPEQTADLVLITHNHPDHNNPDLVRGKPIIARGLHESEEFTKIYQALDRFPNQEEIRWTNAKLRMARSPHAIVVTSIPAWHDDEQGENRGAVAMLLAEVDGVRIVHCGDIGQSRFTEEQLKAMGKVDVLLIPVGGTYTVDGAQAAVLVEQVKPRIVVPIHYKTSALNFDLAGVDPFLTALGSAFEVVRPVGNTLAVSSIVNETESKPRVVVLNYLPWEMPEELAELFAKKESASAVTEDVFAPLSANQMSFRPSNGTHTPRWNAEHMIGRELGFFTEIYAKVDPAFAKIDLNPTQMPPDYEAAHPDWTGAEEARQIERVSALTRRFAYLLADLPLDEQAPGSRWTPRKLLEQMARHYGEHTENVKLKFELTDWPQE
ncbi:MBL fold metallo-hydrolase [Bythopirellula goksoeyrii]|uniref:Metal-dependent hydrolase n=1 Tax=Bythopirellula goksoeyrii TaxID=1400387 RepID=A0A5B9Q8W4_9BACT|nr:MBL fold metallo-hydrolase [Bythopirellula goksoeyrii]QEG33356.1 metal-dependent hydrolase [Bythopirellula goksoeyrii]